MNEEQIHKLTRDIIAANEVSTTAIIKSVVNGKIDALALKVDANHTFIKNHAANDEEWQKKAEPFIKTFETNKIIGIELKRKTGTLVFYVSSFGVIGGFALAVWTYIKSSLH